MKIILVAAALLLAGCVGEKPDPLGCAYPPTDITDSVIKVVSGPGPDHGSAAVVAEGLYVTARHVAKSSHALSVPEEQEVQSLYYLDPEEGGEGEFTDIALLKAPTNGLIPLRVYTQELAPGQEVWVVGYPTLYERMVFKGVFQYSAEKYDGMLVSNAPAINGMSGGAMIACTDDGYALVGVVIGAGIAGYQWYGPMQVPMSSERIGFAVPASKVALLIERMGIGF